MVCNEPALFSGFVFVVLFSLISWKAFNNLVLGFASLCCPAKESCQLGVSSCVNNYILRKLGSKICAIITLLSS